MKALTDQQVRDYRYNGYLYPVPALKPHEAAEALRNLERSEAQLGAPLTKAELKWRGATHTYLQWANDLCRHPRVLDIVEDVLGPDILVYWSTFFIKEPGSATFAAWHQDATYFGIEPLEHVTAWIALSDASREAGCMDVISAQGTPRQYRHDAKRLEHSINGAGQEIVEPVDESNVVAMELKAGELSLHHTLCVHRSAPNRAAHRRVGYGVSYIPAYARLTGSYRLPAMLVRGKDRWGYWDVMPERPRADFAPEALDYHTYAYTRFRENYYEMEARHVAQYSGSAANA